MIFRVKITTSNFNESQRRKIYEAASLVEECFNTRSFRGFILHHEVNGGPGFHMCELNNEEVYAKIMSGAESLDPNADHEADIYIELSYKFTWNTIGYTYATSKWQWIYNRFFKGASIASIAGNLAHEYMHKLGFEHEQKHTILRPYSVPYAVGEYVESYAKLATKKSYFERFMAYFV